ncbi:response regulator [Paenibacillus sp. XY044]|uniref:response regulator transcription factor n=1 Tax=Paenibacillus sp. XY044 TaxID=2026089 RepID=UPI000B9870CD|nr:response regulator [Paenibacillus sp. XY044]OZB92315.1 DNA-binding response regulator [Paenibacillus sp. XY044]
MKLMIVDDEPYILEGLTKMIKEASTGFTQIMEAKDAFEALDKMPGFHPDVVITDLDMPEKDGFELIEETRKAGYCDRFVILTGYDEFEYARKAIRAKVVEYLLKPINQDEIMKILTTIFTDINGPLEHIGHMDKIVDYINRHYSNPLSLDDLAGYTGLHPNYISNLFRKELDITFIHYLNSVRIEKARELLEQDRHLSVHLVGQQVGYESPQYFLKIFKRYIGMTPGLYRENATRSN